MAENESNTTESGSTGETEITATLGMMQLQVQTDAGIEEARKTFEEIWENRVSEIEESEANTLKQELEPDEDSIRRLG